MESQNIDRKKYILEEISTQNKVVVSKLSKKFNVSEVTIRKDLEQLQKKRMLLKVRGGAISIPKNCNDDDDDDLIEKESKNIEIKKKIGKYASTLVNEGDTIVIDSGSTTMELARNLLTKKNITVLTNSIPIAKFLSQNIYCTVMIPGGVVRSKSLSVIGPLSEEFFSNYYCDRLFLGVDSFNISKGLSTPSIEEARINISMINSSKEVIVVADSSKFNKRGFAHICHLNQINTLITDSSIPTDQKEELIKSGINVFIVES